MKTLRGRLWLGFGGLLLIIVAVSTLSVIVLTRYSHALQQVFRENYDSAIFCDEMKDSLDWLDTAAQRRVWGAQPATAGQVDEQISRFNSNLHRQLGNLTLPGEPALTARLADEWNAYEQALHHLDNAAPADRAAVYRRELLPRFQQAKGTAQQVADMNMANMVSVDGQARRVLIGVRNAMLVLVSIGTLLAAVLVGAVGATLIRPLNALRESARQIASGNLDQSLHVTSTDEIGQVVEAFNLMAVQLRHFRRLDHEKLARAQQTTQLAIDSLPDAVLLLAPTGVVEIANRTAAEHFGISPGKTVDQLNLDWLTRLFERIRSDPRPFDPEGYRSAIQIFDHGRERFLLPRAVPVTTEDGKTIGITIVLVDVTRLRHADELKSGLLSTVSHELRTPLTSIRMALGLLTGNKLGTLSTPHQKLLTAATQDSDRLYRIIENLLNISRIEAGKSSVNPQRLAAREVVSLAADPLRHAFEEKAIPLDIQIDPALPDVLADPSSIGYALSNLLSNALKFTPPGGRVAIEVAPAGNSVRFSVSDTGPGIPPEYAGRVFERFFRLHRDNAKTGAGLGLTIAREIVEAHGGAIAFAPRAEGGSCFSFTLPVAASPALAGIA